MALPSFIRDSAGSSTEIKTIEMHTTGEPTRIVYSGFPNLTGTLLSQRAEAHIHHDHIRKALIHEPRGHREMYAAVLRPQTELVESGEAHIGVLFLTNEGYSTMCGHATLAVARLLVDQAGAGPSSSSSPCEGEAETLFALHGKRKIQPNAAGTEVEVLLHVPCGLVHVTVPITTIPSPTQTGTGTATKGPYKTNPHHPISYLSVPSYATGIWVTIPIPPSLRWPELADRNEVVVDIAYGGAFYLIASPAALGFENSLRRPDFAGLSVATARLKEAFNSSPQLRGFYLRAYGEGAGAEGGQLEWLYGTIVTDCALGVPEEGTAGAETSLCFFSRAQVDRSPTGSGVQAKVALAWAKGRRKVGVGEGWTYHSVVSNAYSGEQIEGEGEGDMLRGVGSEGRRDGGGDEAAGLVNGVNSGNDMNGDERAESIKQNVGVTAKRKRCEGAFVGEAVEEVTVGGKQAVIVKVSGWARYTGASTFIIEADDRIGEGFWFDGLGREM